MALMNFGTAFAIATTLLPAIKESKNGHGVSLASALGSTVLGAITMNSFANGGVVGVIAGQTALTAVLMGGGALVGSTINQLRTRPKYNMSIAAPWSAGYEPTERASLAMRRGMEAIQGAQSLLGSEAALYASRYSR